MVGFAERQETQADALQSSARLLEDVELWQLGLQQTSRANGAYLTYLVGTNGDLGTHDWINLVVPTNWLRTQLQYSLLFVVFNSTGTASLQRLEPCARPFARVQAFLSSLSLLLLS